MENLPFVGNILLLFGGISFACTLYFIINNNYNAKNSFIISILFYLLGLITRTFGKNKIQKKLRKYINHKNLKIVKLFLKEIISKLNHLNSNNYEIFLFINYNEKLIPKDFSMIEYVIDRNHSYENYSAQIASCLRCGGTGSEIIQVGWDADYQQCPDCNGKRFDKYPYPNPNQHYPLYVKFAKKE